MKFVIKININGSCFQNNIMWLSNMLCCNARDVAQRFCAVVKFTREFGVSSFRLCLEVFLRF